MGITKAEIEEILALMNMLGGYDFASVSFEVTVCDSNGDSLGMVVVPVGGTPWFRPGP